MLCSFCDIELENMGNSPWPFFRMENAGIVSEYSCCHKCNSLFVQPARQLVKYGISDDDWKKVLYEIKTALAEAN